MQNNKSEFLSLKAPSADHLKLKWIQKLLCLLLFKLIINKRGTWKVANQTYEIDIVF